MAHRDDLITALVERLVQWSPPDGETCDALERELRQQFGGSAVYLKMPKSSYRVETSHAPGVALDPDGKRKLKK